MPDQPSGSPAPYDNEPFSTPQTPGDPKPAPDSQPGHGPLSSGATPNAPQSVDLLNQILNRLQRMEGGLSQHEQWLRRIEEEQQQAEGTAKPTSPGGPSADELQRLVGSLTLELDRTQKNLTETQQQLGKAQQEIRALRNQAAGLQARSGPSQAQGQLQTQPEQAQTLQLQLAEARRQLSARDRQVADLQAAVEQAAARFEVLSADLAARTGDESVAGLADRSWSRFARFALVAAFASGLASVGLTSWLHHRGQYASPHAVSATLLLAGTDAQTFASCAKKAASEAVEVAPDPARRTIELTLRAADPEAGKARLDAIARSLLEPLSTPALATVVPPASQPAAAATAARIAQRENKLGEALPPLEEPQDLPNPTELVAQRQALVDEKSQLAEKLKELSGRLESAQSQPARPVLAAEYVDRAEAADPQLQAENEALRQREGQLAGRLRVSIDTAALQFDSLQLTLTEADAQLQKNLQDDQPDNVANDLATVRESLKTWARAVADLETAWKQQRALLGTSGGGDILRVQSELERSARGFVNEITKASGAMTQAIEHIGQGQDQTTKRLVLRNALVKQFAPVESAQQTVAAAARTVILTDNVELTAIVQRLDALRKQIHQRREQIRNALTQARMSELQKQQSATAAQLREQHQELAHQLASVEAKILDLGEQATALAARQAQHAERLASRTALLEGQAADLKSLIAVHQQFAERVGALPPPPAPGYLPAKVVATHTGSPSFISTLLLGITPVLVCAAALALAWLIIASRRSSQTIEEYARTLKETARQAGLGDKAQVS